MDEEKYKLSVKGFLYMKLTENGMSADKLWDELTEFIAHQAKENGMPDGGLPCLVMIDGGVCITAEKPAKRASAE